MKGHMLFLPRPSFQLIPPSQISENQKQIFDLGELVEVNAEVWRVLGVSPNVDPVRLEGTPVGQ